MGVKDVGVVHIEEGANCIFKMARTIQRIRKKATPSIPPPTRVRPPPRERGTPVKAIRKAKVTAPVVVSFKSMAECMAEAMLKCQQYKRAKAKNGEGKKRVKLTEAEKIGRKENRRMVSEEKKQRKVAERLAARAVRVIANPGKYKKEKGYWTKETKAARKAKWDAGYQGRMDRRFMREQKAKLKEVQKASDGLAVHYNMYISFKLITFLSQI